VQAQEGGIMIEGKYAGDPTSITMQLVCKIKSEIIIIIIIDTMPQSATTVKPMEIKKALLLLYQMLPTMKV
jgi:hypothetical protein